MRDLSKSSLGPAGPWSRAFSMQVSISCPSSVLVIAGSGVEADLGLRVGYLVRDFSRQIRGMVKRWSKEWSGDEFSCLPIRLAEPL